MRNNGCAFVLLQRARDAELAFFGGAANDGFLVGVFERDPQRCCPEIGRENQGDGLPARAFQLLFRRNWPIMGPGLGWCFSRVGLLLVIGYLRSYCAVSGLPWLAFLSECGALALDMRRRSRGDSTLGKAA